MLLDVQATVPDATQSARAKCPIARFLNTTISMTASLNL